MSQATVARPLPVRRAPRGSNPTAGRPALRLVAPTQTASSGVGFVVLCVALVVGGLLTVLLLNTARAQQQYTIGSLQNTSSRLAATQQDLASQVDVVSAPQQLALRAQEYGMVPATKIRYVRASDHRLVGVAGGTSASAPFTVNTLPQTPASKLAGLAVTTADQSVSIDKPAAKPAAKPTESTAAPTKSPSPSAKATAPSSAHPTAPKSTNKSTTSAKPTSAR